MTQSALLKAQSKWEFKVSHVLRGLAQSVSTDHKIKHWDNLYKVLLQVKDKTWILENVLNADFIVLPCTAHFTKKNTRAFSFEPNVLNQVSAGLAS